MSGIAQWYNNSYGNSISGTSRLRLSPFMPSGLRNGGGSGVRAFMVGGGGAAFDDGTAAGGGARFRAGPGGMPMTTAEMVAAAAAAEQQQGGGGDGSANAQQAAAAAAAAKGRTKGEMLFGPDVGDETEAEKGWQQPQQQESGGQESAAATTTTSTTTVPLDVVKNWVERAKQEHQTSSSSSGESAPVHQTTTIQALVNVKRPTIQLAPAVNDGSRHVIRFTYDASTPRARISVTLHDMDATNASATSVPNAQLATTPTATALRVVHSSLVDGGFGKHWQLPESDALDLAALVNERKRALLEARKRAEAAAAAAAAAALRASMESAAESEDLKKGAGGDSMSAVPQLSNTILSSGGGGGDLGTINQTAANDGSAAARPRFGGILGRRQQRQADDEEAQIGDAPQGVEMQQTTTAASPTTTPATAFSGNDGAPAQQAPTATDGHAAIKKEDDLGIKVIITIEGCDENGAPTPRNSQATHFLITSNAPSATADIAGEGTAAAVAADGHEDASDAANRPSAEARRRVWMLRVVRREARIAGHTFLLREIFGLSSATNSEPTAASQVTYPPKADEHQAMDDPYASAPNECIVCLTSPRDVVLLPCRHLVVCRDCAVGMIEFGAGGKVARREDTTAAATTADAATANAADTPTGIPSVVGGANPPAPATRESERRRRKKAKGWFCPVCRQPYTSLLRLALPQKADEEAEAAAAHSMHTLSRQPSIAAASMRSLRRTPSRATLPERGERMLTELQPDENEIGMHAVEAEEVEPERPQFVLEDEAPRREEETPQSKTGGWKQVEV